MLELEDEALCMMGAIKRELTNEHVVLWRPSATLGILGIAIQWSSVWRNSARGFLSNEIDGRGG